MIEDESEMCSIMVVFELVTTKTNRLCPSVNSVHICIIINKALVENSIDLN